MRNVCLSVLAVLLLAGCAAPQTPATETTTPNLITIAPEPTPAASDFIDCRSLELLFPFPADEPVAPAPLRPKTLDPAGAITSISFLFRSCADSTGIATGPQAWGWVLHPVEPLPELHLEQAAAYYWLEGMIGQGPVMERFRSLGVLAQNATVQLNVSDLPLHPGARAELLVKMDGFQAQARSAMIGQSVNRPVASWGIYTGVEASSLLLHSVELGPRQQYPNGFAEVQPGLLVLPALDDLVPGVADAHQDLAHSLRLTLSSPVRPAAGA